MNVTPNPRRQPGRRYGLLALALPSLGLLVVGLFLPLYEVAKDSLWTPGPSLSAYTSVLQDSLVINALVRTFVIAIIVTVLAIVGGIAGIEHIDPSR